MSDKRMVISPEMLPHVGGEEVTGCDGERYLLRNEVMFTALKHSACEHSSFFIALRDDCKIIGHKCSECGQVICPPFETRCPQCNFADMDEVEVSHCGVMAASPVIVFFAPSRFKDDVPFATGYVFLRDKNGRECDTALPVRARTTTGMIRPGVFKKDTPVRVVFKNTRRGDLLDIFVVPESELTEEQLSKDVLMEDELDWDRVCEPVFEKRKGLEEAQEKVITLLRSLSKRIAMSPRAQNDLKNWQRTIRIKTACGAINIVIDDGKFIVEEVEENERTPDLLLVIENLAFLLPWLQKEASLTNLLMEGILWIDKPELETITRLDRLHRSLRRDGV